MPEDQFRPLGHRLFADDVKVELNRFPDDSGEFPHGQGDAQYTGRPGPLGVGQGDLQDGLGDGEFVHGVRRKKQNVKRKLW